MAIWHGRYAILGIQHARCAFRGNLGRAWDAIASWQLQAPVRSRFPMPPEVFKAMSLELALECAVNKSHGELFWLAAWLLRAGFHSLMRPAEILNLSLEDVALPPLHSSEPIVIVIRDPQKPGALGPLPVPHHRGPGHVGMGPLAARRPAPLRLALAREPCRFPAVLGLGTQDRGH